MLAKAVYEVPRDPGLRYEPKWDGFRCVVFRDGDEVELGSRNDRPLTRYFPELPPALRAALPERCVVDGEIVVVTGEGLDFGALQQRIHPAASRIDRLAAETPASFVAFDLIALGDRDPPAPRSPSAAGCWRRSSRRPGAGPDPADRRPRRGRGLVPPLRGRRVRRRGGQAGRRPYRQDQRAMWKVKHQRTADCVVARFRWHKDGEGIGSLLLGLYDGDVLHNVGWPRRSRRPGARSWWTRSPRCGASSWPTTRGARGPSAEAHERAGGPRMPGAPSRWNATKDLSWEPLRPERVIEVRYENLQGGRFRHASRMVRWRDDKLPGQCTYEQLDVAPPAELTQLFGVTS